MTDRIEIKSNISTNLYERLILDFSHKKFGFFNTFPKRSVSSIYFDTDNLKDYFDHVIGSGKRKKTRVRFYNQTIKNESELNSCVLEQKIKTFNVGTKNKLKGSFYNLISHTFPLSAKTFVNYEREYFECQDIFRITLDTKINYGIPEIDKKKFHVARQVISNQKVLEIKIELENYQKSTLLINNFLNFYEIKTNKFSKYCNSIETLGLIDGHFIN